MRYGADQSLMSGIVIGGLVAGLVLFVMASFGACGDTAQGLALATCATVRDLTAHRVIVETR